MKKIIELYGADSQVGTSMLGMSVASSLTASGKSAVLLSLGLRPCGDYIANREKRSVAEIMATLNSETIEPYELMHTLVRENGVAVLPSVDRKLRTYLSMEGYMKLLECCDDFDYIIVDKGEWLHINMHSVAQLAGTEKYIVTTQQEKSMERLLCMKNDLMGDMSAFSGLILNKFQRNISVYSAAEIAKLAGLPVCVKIPYCEYAWEAEANRETLMAYSRFRRAVEAFVNEHILKEADMAAEDKRRQAI